MSCCLLVEKNIEYWRLLVEGILNNGTFFRVQREYWVLTPIGGENIEYWHSLGLSYLFVVYWLRGRDIDKYRLKTCSLLEEETARPTSHLLGQSLAPYWPVGVSRTRPLIGPDASAYLVGVSRAFSPAFTTCLLSQPVAWNRLEELAHFRLREVSSPRRRWLNCPVRRGSGMLIRKQERHFRSRLGRVFLVYHLFVHGFKMCTC